MDSLYKVLEGNKYGKEYYVFASGFDDAANKVKTHLLNKINETPILNKDGDLNPLYTHIENKPPNIIIAAVEKVDESIIIK